MSSTRRARSKNSKFAICAALTLVMGLHETADARRKQRTRWIDNLGVSGSIRPGFWSRDTSYSDQFDYVTGSAWLTLRPKEIAGFKAYLEGYVVGQDFARRSYSEGELREGYIEKSVGHFDFKVGRQITVWGRADKVNPTDNLSVRDYTLLMTDDEDQRKGLFATQVAYNSGSNRFLMIWQPEWRSPVYPLPPVPGLALRDVSPENSQNSFGLKIDRAGAATDWSLSYFNGYSKTPDLRVLAVGQTTLLGLDHPHMQVFGGDFARNIRRYGVRAEAAYTQIDEAIGRTLLQQSSSITGVIGVDRAVSESFNINTQLLYRNILSFHDPNSIPVSLRALARAEAAIANQKYAEQLGATIRPSFKAFNETLEVEVAVVVWFSNGDSLVRPKITYAFTDNLKGIAGAALYNGPSDTFFGQLQGASAGFGELRYIF